jgi:hypothetical protein
MAETEYKFGIGDLAVGDDLDISLNNDDYQDQANPAPPAKGNYELRTLALGVRKTKEGALVLQGGKFPILVLEQVEIVDGYQDQNGNTVVRKVSLFQDVETRVFDRYGASASQLNDLMRAYGAPNYSGLDEAKNILKEMFETQATFRAQLDWGAYDKLFIEAAREQLEIPEARENRDDNEKKILNAIYKQGRITGMQNFPFANGRFTHVLRLGDTAFKNPVTNQTVTIEVENRTIEARPIIGRYYAKTETVALGPSAIKPRLKVAA